MEKYLQFDVKTIPSDFLVNECLCLPYSQTKESQFEIILLRKCGYTTFQAIKSIAVFFKIPIESIGYAGLKDEDGITSQKISIDRYMSCQLDLESFNNQYKTIDSFIYLSRIGDCCENIQVGKLVGNSFRLILRNMSKISANFLNKKRKFILIFPNYFDSQRFGLPDRPHVTHLVGEQLLLKNFDKAYQYYLRGRGIQKLPDSQIDYEAFFASIEGRNLSFYYNSYFSFLFNQELAEKIRIIDYTECELFSGYFLLLPSRFLDLATYNILGDNTEYTKYTITEKGLISRVSKRTNCICTNIEILNVDDDELNPEMKCVELTFFLPSGCYATMAMKQLQLFLGNPM